MTSIGECSLAVSLESERSNTDHAALAALVDQYAPLLFRVAHSILRSQAEAEDIVQDTFVRVLQHHRALPAVRDLRVWLVRITWNLSINRRHRIRPEQMDAAFAQTLVALTIPADQALDEADRIATVLRELDRLPKEERNVLLLAAVEELDTSEIAHIVGRSESAVRALLFRARARLRNRLDRKGDKA